MKAFIAGLGTETNTFSPFVTGYHNFEETMLIRNGEHGDAPGSFSLAPLTWRRLAHERGWETVESLVAFAVPAGITLRHVYEEYRDEILADLEEALPVDAVFLNMHGAMVAQGYDDCEGDLTARVRAIVGPDVPIGVELDLHCHLTELLVGQATAVILYKEYPHTDFAERAAELFTIIADTAAGKIRPHSALFDCESLGVFHTSREPMRSYVDRMSALEEEEGVLSVSLSHSFPWGDVEELGVRTLVITDDRPDLGKRLARELCDELKSIRAEVQPAYRTIDEALDEALAHDGRPVVLADVSDNSGGGAPNDSTFVLSRMLERGIDDAAVAMIWDPIVVDLAMEAEEGATFDVRLGGKMGPMSGDPLDLRVEVTRCVPGATQTVGAPPHTGTSRLGDAVALRTGGIDIVVCKRRTQTFNPDAFSNLGIDPLARKILVVKSMQHFYAGFGPIASKVIYIAAPGSMLPRFDLLDYQKARKDLWPR